MIYESTRNSELKASASKAVLEGIAPDSGLYVPRNISNISLNISEMVKMDYRQMACEVLGRLFTDYSKEDIAFCVEAAYGNGKEGGKFYTQEIAPVSKLGDSYMLELYHGRTCAFKDVALSILPLLVTTAKKMNNDETETIILTATSGDTGKAALEGFKDVPGTRIGVFFPSDGVSAVQKAQMVTQTGGNTYVCAINGNFDDAQTAVKTVFTNNEVKESLKKEGKAFSSANSINIGRLVPQIVYYFYAYKCLCDNNTVSVGDKVNFVVPTGNFGNILAGWCAREMGLPVGKLICASNSNDVLTEFINTGRYNKKRSLILTQSPSMDILISSNLERLLYYASGCDNAYVASLMRDLSVNGEYTVSDDVKDVISEVFYAGSADENETCDALRKAFYDHGRLIDTHTAVAYKVYRDYREKTGDVTPSVVLSTASPFKFAQSVYGSLFGDEKADDFEYLELLSQKTGEKIPEPLNGLKERPVLHNTLCEKDEIMSFVNTVAGI